MHSDLEFDPFVVAIADAMQALLVAAKKNPAEKVRLLIAFSGGPDSTSLLYALHKCAVDLNLELSACHINHGLRGEESAADLEFCQQICQKLQIPLQVETLENVSSRAEADLRQARYACLQTAANALQCSLCVTGHSRDDQVETLLFRLFRGTGPYGMLGIPALRKLGPNLTVLRPMLNLNHKDAVDYLARLGVEARTDSSNLESAYSRNYIRNQIVPLIESRFPEFGSRVDQFRSLLKDDQDYIEMQQKSTLSSFPDLNGQSAKLDSLLLCSLPLSIRRRIISNSLIEHQVEPSIQRVEAILEMLEGAADCAISMNQNWDLRLAGNILLWQDKRKPSLEYEDLEFEYKLEPLGTTLIAPLSMMLNFRSCLADAPCPTEYPGKFELELYADLSTLDGDITLRLRRPGDQIQPLGMSSPVRLKKFLHTHKSSQTLTFSGHTVVMTCGSEIIWIPGCGMSQKIAVKNKPTHRISFYKIAPDFTGLS